MPVALDGVDAAVVEAEVELAVLVPPLVGRRDEEALADVRLQGVEGSRGALLQ